MKGWEALVIKTGSEKVINYYRAGPLFSCYWGWGADIDLPSWVVSFVSLVFNHFAPGSTAHTTIMQCLGFCLVRISYEHKNITKSLCGC